VDVLSAKTQIIDFTLNGIPVPEISVAYLDFGLDLTSLSFSISNTGKGKLTYHLIPSQDWITADPVFGDVTDETDDITVTIDKTGLSDSIYKETIEIISGVSQDTIYVYLNGLMDIDLNYYKVVTIGTQTWMAENLNTGNMINYPGSEATDNGMIEKYCYGNNIINCDVYGGLYETWEGLAYDTSEFVQSGYASMIIQGICPDGWHVAAESDWQTLYDYFGGKSNSGGALKDIGTIQDGTGLWQDPNTGATNESGFTALPGGAIQPVLGGFIEKGLSGLFWRVGGFMFARIDHNTIAITDLNGGYISGSVRCVKDP
ncbi:MAG: hypothetical protein KAX05_16075, partial [Bacteroidales bacterium]|nr:hypothetical protein [Bacteroidales bacterium]